MTTSPPRRIGVLTFHRCINYGSYWQARCLVEGLRARGHDAVLVDHDSPRIRRTEWKCALQPVLPTAVPKRDYLLYGLKLLKFSAAFASLPRSPRFALEDPSGMERYDTVVVGSDEVWNLDHPWFGGCPLFFGEGVRAGRLASYAASLGSYDGSRGLEPWWVDRLRRFSAISVRDENSRLAIGRALGLDPEVVLDPCLQFPPRPRGRWRGPEEPFVAVYGHNFAPPFQRSVRRWAAGRGCRLVSIGYRNDWADDQWITAGPHDFPWFIARAEAVATNFFHGCVFALRFARPFVCEASSYRSVKIRNLMAALGGDEHIVSENTPPATYEARLSRLPDKEIQHNIHWLRQTSSAYLDRALA